MPISPYHSLSYHVPGKPIFINVKRIIFITSLFVASFSYTQTDSTDAVFDAVFEAMLRENTDLLREVSALQDSVAWYRTHRATERIYITERTNQTYYVAEIARLQRALRDTTTWIADQAWLNAMLYVENGVVQTMPLRGWHIHSRSARCIVLRPTRRSGNIMPRFELTIPGRTTTYYKEMR